MEKMDLHTHSNKSDGTLSPREVVAAAREAGVALLALTDHDCTLGVAEALEAGKALGIRVIPGMELDTEFPTELHMLGLHIDPANEELQAFMAENTRRRQARNEAILQKLAEAGADVRPFLPRLSGNPTRLHVALALVQGGYAQSIGQAFQAYLNRGMPGYVDTRRISPEDAIGLIHRAGGLAVLAHPCKLKADVPALVARLAGAGLDGIEAYYPTATPGQRAEALALARQHGLLVSCGSDFHGANRPANALGCAWAPDAALEPIYERLAAARP